MAWVTRQGNRRYYYRSKKIAGRIIHTYCGTGHRAELAAAEDTERRTQRQALQEARRADRACWQAALTPFREFDDLVDQLSRASLLADGYHQHARGNWRRRRP
jgi:hypothetical protein